jgi:hypothetical protein
VSIDVVPDRSDGRRSPLISRSLTSPTAHGVRLTARASDQHAHALSSASFLPAPELVKITVASYMGVVSEKAYVRRDSDDSMRRSPAKP